MVTPCDFDQSQANCYQQTDLNAIFEIKTPKNKRFQHKNNFWNLSALLDLKKRTNIRRFPASGAQRLADYNQHSRSALYIIFD